jgi:hypothetical protein
MTSSYDPMPPAEQAKLRELFAPFNEELFALIGERYAW